MSINQKAERLLGSEYLLVAYNIQCSAMMMPRRFILVLFVAFLVCLNNLVFRVSSKRHLKNTILLNIDLCPCVCACLCFNESKVDRLKIIY